MTEPAYVYCFLPGDIVLPTLTGASDMRTVRQGDIQAVVSAVPSILRQAPLSPEDMKTLARVHHSVSQQVLSLGTPIPLRIGTVVDGDDRVRDILRRVQPLLTHALSALQHQREWGVKLRIDDEKLARHIVECEADLRAIDERMTRVGEGARYLLRKQRQRIAMQARDRWIEDTMRSLASTLGSRAQKWVRLNPTAGEARSAAVLVQRSAEEAFVDEIRRYGAGLGDLAALKVTGPWPPYNFTPQADL